MNKEEILKKSIEENRYLDEKQQNEVMQSFGFGGIIVALLCLFFCMMNAIKGKSFYEFTIIIFWLYGRIRLEFLQKDQKDNVLHSGNCGHICCNIRVRILFF